MLDAAAKALFHSLAGVDLLKRLATRYGMLPYVLYRLALGAVLLFVLTR